MTREEVDKHSLVGVDRVYMFFVWPLLGILNNSRRQEHLHLRILGQLKATPKNH